ncbi:unnamed protein product, partial [Prunus brigantina]
TDCGVVAPDAEDGSDTDVEIIGDCSSPAPPHGIGKGFMTGPVPLTTVYADGRQEGLGVPGHMTLGHQPEASTSGRGESAAGPSSRPKVSPKDGEVVFFTDVLLQGVRLPLQPAVQKILAMIGYAPGQFNPNFWVALMGVVTAFGMADQGEPSYEQFSHLYSVTRSKTNDHGGWVQANCLRAAERGHFVSHVPTSQKSWRNRRVLLSGDWESPSGSPVRFHIPTTFQIAGKLKQPVATQAELRQIDLVRARVPAVEREYPQFLFTANLIKAQLVNPAEMTDERRDAEKKRLSESSKRRLMMGLQGQKKKRSQPESVPIPSASPDVDGLSLAERLRQMGPGSGPIGPTAPGSSTGRGAPAEGASSIATGKRVVTVDVDDEPPAKRGRQSEVPRAIFSVEDDDDSTDPVTLACPSKAVQFANHMIKGPQMELSEIEELPKRALREEAGRAFRLQASGSMDMWLLVKRALTAAERSKKAYEDGKAKVAEAGKAIQAHATLEKDLKAAERQIKSYEATFAEMTAALESAKLSAKEALEAKEAVQVALEDSERAKASEIEAAV